MVTNNYLHTYPVGFATGEALKVPMPELTFLKYMHRSDPYYCLQHSCTCCSFSRRLNGAALVAAALRGHPVGTPPEPTPQVSWALGGRGWPPPIAAVGPLGALPRPGCAHAGANSVHGGSGRMYPSLGRRCGVTPSVHRRNPLHR